MWQCPKCGRSFTNTNQQHFCESTDSIEDYITGQPAEVQAILRNVRETIQKAAPKAIEKISWQMPTYWQGENLIHFAAFKNHLGIYPGDLTFSPFDERLSGYKRTKGAIQFPFDRPIDYGLIADITRWRVACVDGGDKSRNAAGSRRMTRPVYDMPDYIAAALDQSGMWARYQARPPYQRNDYVGWIARGKREETRQKRLTQMLEELQGGDAYMGMSYTAKNLD